MLIDPEKRQVYDIYGKQGLSSGLEVGEHLRTRDELRTQWQQFQQQQVRHHRSYNARRGLANALVQRRYRGTLKALPGQTDARCAVSAIGQQEVRAAWILFLHDKTRGWRRHGMAAAAAYSALTMRTAQCQLFQQALGAIRVLHLPFWMRSALPLFVSSSTLQAAWVCVWKVANTWLLLRGICIDLGSQAAAIS